MKMEGASCRDKHMFSMCLYCRLLAYFAVICYFFIFHFLSFLQVCTSGREPAQGGKNWTHKPGKHHMLVSKTCDKLTQTHTQTKSQYVPKLNNPHARVMQSVTFQNRFVVIIWLLYKCFPELSQFYLYRSQICLRGLVMVRLKDHSNKGSTHEGLTK